MIVVKNQYKLLLKGDNVIDENSQRKSNDGV